VLPNWTSVHYRLTYAFFQINTLSQSGETYN
jgi:hypothetical protein